MIGNITRIAHVRPLLKYLSNRTEATLLTIDTLTLDPEKFPGEIEIFNSHRHRLEKGAAHAILSLRPTESLTPEAWLDVIEEVRRRSGYEDAPMLAFRHTDRKHDHVHLVFGVTRYDGTAVPDRFEKKKFQRIAQEVAVQHGLERVDSERMRTRASPREYWRHVHGDQLLNAVQRAWAEPTFKAFQEHLIKQGVEPAYHIRRSDGFLQGIKFRYHGRWVKGRSLGKQFAAAAFRKDFRIDAQDVREMLSQNQKLGERHDPVVLKVSGAERRDLPHGTAYRVSVDQVDVVPALPYSPKTPPVRLPCDFSAYAKRLSQPVLDTTFIDRLDRVRDREPTWIAAHIERTVHPWLREDPLAAKACRVMAHHLLGQPERNPALILELAQADPDPRFVPLLERLYQQFEPARFLASFEENPERYARLMTSIAKLRSEITFAELRRTPVTLENLRAWERRILTCARARRVKSLPSASLRHWREELVAGKRSDFSEYLSAYRDRWERTLYDAGPELARLSHRLEAAPKLPDRMTDLIRAGHVASIRMFLGAHDPQALVRPGRADRRPGRLKREWTPKATRRALAKMRSPVRGLVATLARHLRIPYAGLVLLPANLVATQIRRTLTRTTETALDFDKHQKTLFRLAQGRVLSTAILHRDVLTR